MPGFFFRLVWADGSPADPPTLEAAVPNWQCGDTISLGGSRILRVVKTLPADEPDGAPVLVVEEDRSEGAAARRAI
jgi:hypothetical protein